MDFSSVKDHLRTTELKFPPTFLVYFTAHRCRAPTVLTWKYMGILKLNLVSCVTDICHN
jgi:hypothetical protein